MKQLPRTILYGGDYNPEQWPRSVWEDDYAGFDQARINTLTVNVFSWAALEPREGRYEFGVLDEIVERAERAGRYLVLATSTGAMPPWLATDYPEVLRVDFEGRQHGYGQRHNACPSSEVFRRRSAELAGVLAERYARSSGLVVWHVGNEYGGACYCQLCVAGFRTWLQARYGSLDQLNEAWNGSFWSHNFSDWGQIVAPNALTEHWRGEDHTAFQGITLDYRRFMTDALLECYLVEKRAIRQWDEETPVTTNFMGLYRPIDYFRWSEHLDLATWDNYPPTMRSEVRMALTHDLNRGLKGGQPFWVMEQTPSRTASRDVNPLKRPGVMRLWSWQAVAHGADAVMFFQMRASRGACEKYHGAVLDHAGRTDTRVFREVAGLGAEFAALGDLTIGGTTPARVALIWDWDSWWAWEMTDGINRCWKYIDAVLSFYRAWWGLGVDIDVLPINADLSRYDVVLAPLLHMVKGDIVDRLSAVVVRGGTVVTGVLSGRVDESDNAYLGAAGSALAELAGIRIDEIDAAEPGETVKVRWATDSLSPSSPLSLSSSSSPLSPSSPVSPASPSSPVSPASLPAESPQCVLPPHHQAQLRSESLQCGEAGARGGVTGAVGVGGGTGMVGGGTAGSVGGAGVTGMVGGAGVGAVSASLVMEVITPVVAEVLATCESEFYAGTPVVTRRTLGQGQIIYIATQLNDLGMDIIASQVANHHGLTGPYPEYADIETARRTTNSGEVLFVLNHADDPLVLPAPMNCRDVLTAAEFAAGDEMEMPAKGVRVLLTDDSGNTD